MENQILSVRELTRRIREGLEERFPFVWVRGEAGNVSRPSSGHLYFSLKDEDALLNCVWFKTSQRDDEHFDPLTGEVFGEPRPSLARTLRDGQRLLCAGRIGVYAPRGAYQLVVELVQADGAGLLAQAFEALKQELAAKGYFAPERKRPLPAHPIRVALITAPGGAAVRDFLRIASERGYGAEIRIHPVPVQGDAAAPAVAAALARINAEGWARIAVLLRGGGSLEDLWAFNERAVAEAIFISAVPVLTGIGHETDTSLADLTADAHAATPSHAAQMLWPLRAELVQRVDNLELALRRAALRLLGAAESRLYVQERVLRRLSPVDTLKRREQALARARADLRRAALRFVRERDERPAALRARLVAAGEKLCATRGARLELALSRLARVQLPASSERRLDDLVRRLHIAARRVPVAAARALERCETILRACDPHAPLRRGYALVYGETGEPVRGVRAAQPGDALRLRLIDGALDVLVTASQEEV